jgi:uncharacterized protein YndB with AHSA1/START domain
MGETSPAAASRASRIIPAAREAVYDAFMDRDALPAWLPPGGMTGEIHAFDARVGGGYTMSLFYPPDERTVRGKTTDREDRVEVRFVELDRPRRIVESVRFDTGDPADFGEMTLTATFAAVSGGTEVTLEFASLPPGLRPEDNDAGARMSLDQLARWLERAA